MKRWEKYLNLSEKQLLKAKKITAETQYVTYITIYGQQYNAKDFPEEILEKIMEQINYQGLDSLGYEANASGQKKIEKERKEIEEYLKTIEKAI